MYSCGNRVADADDAGADADLLAQLKSENLPPVALSIDWLTV